MYAEAGDYGTLPLAFDYGQGRDWISASAARMKPVHGSVPTGGQTVSLAEFATISQLYVLNEDLTNYITVTWTSAGTANSQRVPAGQPLVIPQADVANVTLTANSAACVATFVAFGT